MSAICGCEWSVSYPCCFIWQKSPLYPLERRLGGLQSWSGCSREKSLLLLGTEPQSSST